MLTDWYPPEIKPVRVGEYEISFFDCGWQYEYRAWWDGAIWRATNGGGWSFVNQELTWRGQTEPTA